MWLNRTLCEILEEMRKACSTLNFSYMLGLVEEAQYMGDKMEAALADAEDVRKLHEKRKKLLNEVKQLEAKKELLESKEEEEN